MWSKLSENVSSLLSSLLARLKKEDSRSLPHQNLKINDFFSLFFLKTTDAFGIFKLYGIDGSNKLESTHPFINIDS